MKVLNTFESCGRTCQFIEDLRHPEYGTMLQISTGGAPIRTGITKMRLFHDIYADLLRKGIVG